MFYFAWVNKSETSFNSGTHAREDEDVYGFTLQHAEGEFPSLSVDILNPRVGFLTSSRKQWVWLSYRKQDNSVVPLFFGRLVGVPEQLHENIVRVSFLARPPDYEAQREAVAEGMKVAPFYSDIWLSAEEKLDPDSVLEGYPSLWHIDRITHEVTASDILTGEDGTISFGDSEVFYDSLNISFSESPARRAIVEAEVEWLQSGSGDMDISGRILKAFETSKTLKAISGDLRPSKGVINIMGGDELIKAWPKFGARIGGGWSVGESWAEVVGDPPNTATVLGNIEAANWARMWTQSPHTSEIARILFDKTPGILLEVKDTATTPVLGSEQGWLSHAEVHFMWVPIWQVAAHMTLHWEAARKRTEKVRFEVLADVQPLLTEAGEDETIRLSYGPADVDEVIGDARRNRFFATGEGKQAFEALLYRARAHLLARARAVDVSFEVPFESGLSLSCRKNAGFSDDRLPGGAVAGKVKSYTLSADGDSGVLKCAVTIGASVGRSGTVSAATGDPEYVDDGYVSAGYQTYSGGITVPSPERSDIGYGGLDGYSISDDGVNLYSVGLSTGYLRTLVVEGNLDVQQEAAEESQGETAASAVEKIAGIKSRVALTLRPVTGGPFLSEIEPTITELKVPRTINLETT